MTTHTEPVHTPDLSRRSTGQLISDVGGQLTRLIRTELRLAQLELQRKGKQAGAGAAMLGAAGVLGLLGGGTLVATAVIALDIVLDAWLAALIVAAVLLLAAGISALVGRARLKHSAPAMPEASLEAIRQDYHDLSEAIRR
ncbi:membrane protein [Saccharopolyspora subtropica]|uniref:Membrane protein n=1 Tax=Saccharopolyspora thermophila TaxID=89367 RepID=A0A917JXS8_9PSEU|nr:phage holin family protein [Saccharopolyspora subtropica]GGI89391.1 membrane protein [Saccharopolyspora subtropica]